MAKQAQPLTETVFAAFLRHADDAELTAAAEHYAAAFARASEVARQGDEHRARLTELDRELLADDSNLSALLAQRAKVSGALRGHPLMHYHAQRRLAAAELGFLAEVVAAAERVAARADQRLAEPTAEALAKHSALAWDDARQMDDRIPEPKRAELVARLRVIASETEADRQLRRLAEDAHRAARDIARERFGSVAVLTQPAGWPTVAAEFAGRRVPAAALRAA